MMNKAMTKFLASVNDTYTVNSKLEDIIKTLTSRINIQTFQNLKIVCIGEINNFDYNFIINTFGNLSEYEHFNNHIHITDLIKCNINESLLIGKYVFGEIKKKLTVEYSYEQFISLLSFDGADTKNTIVRFFMNRTNEELYNEKDIEFAEGILIGQIN